MFDALLKHREEFARALSNGHYERMDDGRVLFPKQRSIAAGVFRSRVNGGDEMISANAMMYAGLEDILKVYFAQSAQRTAFYIVPYSNNVDPAQDLVASTIGGVLGEFINYNESARPTWAKDAEASQSIANATTPAVFTISDGGGTVWGAWMTTGSAKSSSTSQLVVCASQFPAVRSLLATDKLSLEYAITAADGG